MSLDFYHTCPTIDGGISDAKHILQDHIDDIVSDLSPRFYSADNGRLKNEFIIGCVEQIYRDLEYAFDGVRKTNEDMRSAADDQISNLEEEIKELKDRIKELELEVEQLERDTE